MTKASKVKEPTYSLRIWQNGEVLKELGPFTRWEAARAWQTWYKHPDYGTELLADGKHIPIGRVGKELNLKATAFRAIQGGAS